MRRLLSATALTSAFAILLALASLRCGDPLPSDAQSDAATATEASTSDASSDAGLGTEPDPAAVANQYVDGSRLKASMFVTSDGARQFRGWYDTALGALCDFVRQPDGKLRCVPRGANDTPLYAGAACDEPSRVVFRAACEEAPKFARQQIIVGECEPTYRVFRVGDAVPSSGYYARSSETGPCPASPTPLKAGEELRARGTELVAADLVEGTEIDWTAPTPTGPAAVTVRLIQGADGSKGFHRLLENIKGETCELRAASTATAAVRCVPARTLLELDYTNPTCTQPAFASYAGQACARPAFGKVFVTSADACQNNEEFYVLSPQATPELYRKTATSCEALPLDGGTYGSAFYVSGTAYGLDNFALATPVPFTQGGGRRLERLQYVLADGTKVPRGFADFGRWRDHQRNEDCELRPAADGKFRCVPIAQATVSVATKYFTDANCTAPVATPIAVPTGCERPVRVIAASTSDANGCATPHVHSVGALVTTTLYRTVRGGACTIAPPDVNKPKYELGAEIAPTDLAEVTPTVP